ncbi:MAG: hypothetical protein Fur0018_25280 [Anaerolineales bacterium]
MNMESAVNPETPEEDTDVPALESSPLEGADVPQAVATFQEDTPSPERSPVFWQALVLLLVFVLGGVGGYFLRGYLQEQHVQAQLAAEQQARAAASAAFADLLAQVNPQGGYALPVAYGDLGPQLLASGAIDLQQFTQVYEASGDPLTAEQLDILRKGSAQPITFTASNAHFLLNFFWALGLVNRNSLLLEGPMMQYGGAQGIGSFASTGGWSIGKKPATDLYASVSLVPLTSEQQARLDEVAFAVFRPCCNNPAAFPDCNHGMAMLGMLTLLAASDASTEAMFTAAKYANAYWYPQQSMELALFFQKSQNVSFEQADSALVTSAQVASSAGYRQVHQWLGAQGLLPQAPNQGNGCGV